MLFQHSTINSTMPKYNVTYYEMRTYELYGVEADSEEDAIEIARNMPDSEKAYEFDNGVTNCGMSAEAELVDDEDWDE
jgi:excinuclease UvrABC nuclease subunit